MVILVVNAVFDDVADQFVWMYRHARDSVTGLCTHGWDESRAQRWADTSTGRSPAFWGRAMGWYVMGLVDVLDVLPVDHPRRNELIGILKELSAAVLRFRDRETGLWYQVVDQGGRPGNYAESSASAMFTYAFAKGANKGYLDALYAAAARESFEAITKHFLSVDAKGLVHLGETCAATGLGGTPYRDGSYNYYVGIPRVEDDPRGIGPFLLAAMELGTGPPANGGRK